MPILARRKTRIVHVGGIPIGGKNPVVIQSMCTTKTFDVPATIAQIKRLEKAGCQMVRVAVPTKKDADALSAIKKKIHIPLIADIHFQGALALEAIKQGVDKVRLNPGNLRKDDLFQRVILAAKVKKIPVRIGVNAGSLEPDLLEKYSYPKPAALVESALRCVKLCESLAYDEVIISLKSSTVSDMVQAYRLFSAQSDYPLHLGVTEAGPKEQGSVKSAVGIGALLLDGIGDTFRVSLTAEPEEEIRVCKDILKAAGLPSGETEIISCPGCGRLEIDLFKLVAAVEKKLKPYKLPIKVAVMGCAVNGPGESREADFGISGGMRNGVIFRKGKALRAIKEGDLLKALLEEISKEYNIAL